MAETLKTADVQTEVPFATLIGGQLITGVIDVLATLPDGSALIVDWKTGAHFDEHEDDYDLQREIYALAVLRARAAPASVGARWVHLESTNGEQTDRWVAEGTEALAAHLDLVTRTVLSLAAVSPVQVRDGRCRGCPGTTRGCPAVPDDD